MAGCPPLSGGPPHGIDPPPSPWFPQVVARDAAFAIPGNPARVESHIALRLTRRFVSSWNHLNTPVAPRHLTEWRRARKGWNRYKIVILFGPPIAFSKPVGSALRTIAPQSPTLRKPDKPKLFFWKWPHTVPVMIPCHTASARCSPPDKKYPNIPRILLDAPTPHPYNHIRVYSK